MPPLKPGETRPGLRVVSVPRALKVELLLWVAECHPGTEEVPYTRPGRHQDTLHERRFSHLEPPDAEDAEGDEQHREKDIGERQYQQARPSYPDHRVYRYPRHSLPRNQHRWHQQEGRWQEPEMGR